MKTEIPVGSDWRSNLRTSLGLFLKCSAILSIILHDPVVGLGRLLTSYRDSVQGIRAIGAEVVAPCAEAAIFSNCFTLQILIIIVVALVGPVYPRSGDALLPPRLASVS